jgi:hypothetical protein
MKYRGEFMEYLMFDYRSLGEELAVPSEIVYKFEQEAHKEFPFDNMLMEIHILRAIKAYAKTTERTVSIEN